MLTEGTGWEEEETDAGSPVMSKEVFGRGTWRGGKWAQKKSRRGCSVHEKETLVIVGLHQDGKTNGIREREGSLLHLAT